MPDLNETRAKAREMLPSHMVHGVLGYIERGEPVGGFLSALFSNDLRGTFERADDINQRSVLAYIRFLYNHAPTGCWGSRERFEAWQDKGGIEGKPTAADECERCGGSGIEPASITNDAGDGEGEDRPCSVCG